ncbi:coiled-coil domain-containing protein 169-like [Ciona intestinalis]
MERGMEDYSLEEMEAELEHERQMKKMLDQSLLGLKITVEDLEKKYQQIDEEGNEWKTRYETQQEMNTQLELQIKDLKDKLKPNHRTNSKNRKDPIPVSVKNMEDLSESGLKGLVKQMEKERSSLQNQLRDLEWRLDQESKALYKASEGRKKYLTELADAEFRLDSYMKLQAKKQAQRENNGINMHKRILPPLPKRVSVNKRNIQENRIPRRFQN